MPRLFSIIILVFAANYINISLAANTIVNNDSTITNQQIKQLQTSIDEAQQNQNDLEDALRNTELSLANISKNIAKLNIKLTTEKNQLLSLNFKQQHDTDLLNSQRSALAAQIRAAYQLNHLESLEIISNQQTPAAIQRYIFYYRLINKTRLKLISNIQTILQSLQTNTDAIKQHQQSLQQLLLSQQQQFNQQKNSLLARKKLLIELHQHVMSKQQQLISLQTNQNNLQHIVRQLIIPTKNNHIPFMAMQHRLKWPVHGKIIVAYTSRLPVRSKSTGIVISAPENTPVQAIYNGKVVFANWLRGFGLLVIIDHGNGYMSLYARNHNLNVKVGDIVNRGAIIATVGNSGGYNEANLYFEIRYEGIPMNPSLWCHQ